MKDGFITGVSDYDYHRLPGISPTRARNMLTSPRAYRAACDEQFEPTDEMKLGTAVHIAALEPATFHSRVVEYRGTRTGKAWEQFKADNSDKLILSPSYYERAFGCLNGLRDHAAIRAALDPAGRTEIAMAWTSDNGTRCRGKMDYVHTRIIDVKTASAIDDRSIIRSVVDLAYHMQLAAYRDGYRRLTGETLDTALIFVETRAPFDARIVRVEGPELERGLELWNRCLDRIQECEANGEWPGISTVETPLVLPEWAMGEVDELGLTLNGETL